MSSTERARTGPAAIGFLLVALAAEAAPELSPTEVAMASWIQQNTGSAVALIEELVNINSGTMNHDGVREVGRVLAGELRDLGFLTEWIELPPESQRAGHLFARRAGDRGKKILLIGHLDTVFEKDDPFQRLERRGSIAYGPGAEDMKGGNVVIVYALKALAAVGALEGARVVVAYTGDEESPGEPLAVSRKDLIEAGQWADVALGFESGFKDDEAQWATVSRRSSSEWVLEVGGRQSHSSNIFNEQTGAGAIFEAARILNGFYERVRGEQYLTFNAGSILGGTEVDYDLQQTRGTVFGKTNVVPNRVMVHGGMRTISEEQTERARAAMRAVVAEHLPHTEASIRFEDGYPAMAPTDGNIALQQMLSEINVALGGEPMPALDPLRRGAADISFVAPYTDALAGMGANGKHGHTPQEELDLSSIPAAVQRAAILIFRLTQRH